MTIYMHQLAKQIAENATFQAFINSYIREVSDGNWIEREDWVKEKRLSIFMTGTHILELDLLQQATKFAFEINYRSLTGRHMFGASLKYCEKEQEWKQEDQLTIILALIHELHLMAKANGYGASASHFDELILRLIESYHTMTNYIENRIEDAETLYSENSTFIENEQSLLFGHWLHPTPKSRQGMAGWQQKSFAPELKGTFQLHYFQVDCTIVKQASVLEESASDLIHQSMSEYLSEIEILDNKYLIPMHPLQAEWLLQQPYVKKAVEEGFIMSIGPSGPLFTATSSLRTIYDPNGEWMYKFSIPVKVTNSLRVSRNHELRAGIAMARLMKKINFLEKYPVFQLIDDPAYITVDLPSQKESGFEVIFRSNIFPKGQDKGISLLAALVQEPLPNHTSQLYNLIVKIAKEESRTVEAVSFDWFKKYWHCSIDPLIRLYDEHGIALEAHQQNSVLNISEGYPTAYYYRDNQGYYLSKMQEEKLRRIEPSLDETEDLFYEDALIHERFTYYLFMNQLFSVIHRFGADELLDERTLLEWSIEQLCLLERELTGQGKLFVQTILKQEELAFKANLLTRFHDVDELMADLEQAVYTKIHNPFVLHRKEEAYATAFSY
jgi:spermidine-citrate ligase